jgi:excisionase family DNA binding protein
MDGYSIKEAAAVLGIPKRRVRELVGRGVLTATSLPDGSLRVHLQADAPAATDPGAGRRHRVERTAHGAVEPGLEGSPFRELLTEFRNLTERYGQALLALGEARGEVASLRGRIEVLEARMDLRLPTSAAARVTDWRPAALQTSEGQEPPTQQTPTAELADETAEAWSVEAPLLGRAGPVAGVALETA